MQERVVYVTSDSANSPAAVAANSVFWVVVALIFVCVLMALCSASTYPTYVYAVAPHKGSPQAPKRRAAPQRRVPARDEDDEDDDDFIRDFIVTLDR